MSDYEKSLGIDLNGMYLGQFLQSCRVVYEDLQDGYCRVSAEVDERVFNHMGSCHGGYMLTLMDTAAGIAVRYAGGRTRTAVTSNCSINFLRPVQRGKVTAEARAVRIGSRLAVMHVEMHSGGRLNAEGTFTFFYLEDEF